MPVMDFLSILNEPPRERNVKAARIFTRTTKDSRDRLYLVNEGGQFERLQSPSSYEKLNRILGNGTDWAGDLHRLRIAFKLCPDTGLST